MRVIVLGGGPAGLYAATQIRRRVAGAQVTLIEQNPEGATYGFGVVFSDQALAFLMAGDPETHAALTPKLATWRDMTLDIEGTRIVIDGIGFAAIGRLALIQILTERARAAGVELTFATRLAAPAELPAADLVIAADGVNSSVRDGAKDAFGTEIGLLSNRFAWFGTPAMFATLTQTFRRTPEGAFNAHHYRYAPGMSTFIVECDAATFARAGLAQLDEAATRHKLEGIFVDALRGAPLISNRSLWRQFPLVTNRRWSHGNVVLIGDALHTAHFSIGSGTRLALEDALVLADSLAASPRDVGAALAAFEAVRRPAVDKLVAAATASAHWYERFANHLRLPPYEMALSYISRSGRVNRDRLRELSPRFAADYERATAR